MPTGRPTRFRSRRSSSSSPPLNPFLSSKHMRNAFAVARKELSIYFTTPWAYVVSMFMIGVSAFFFLTMLDQFKQVQQMARAFSWARMPPEYAMYKNLTDGVIVPLWGIVEIITL